ncbi:STAM-binding protein [Apodemus speciosus]|uniref:STAM-binding protein n=1 Tax=Apodemus speciosus TaxID=105296 RepID=A0ABQ0EXH1_APOSI
MVLKDKNKGGEVGPGAPITSKEAQSYSVTTRTFSPTVVPLGKEARDEAAPTTSPAAKEAAETGTLERPVSTVEKDRDLCLVVLPHDLFDKFLTAARMNTKKKIETCGVLCGALTHPTQTAFLSSVDLYTHFGYQTMLPESIAVVCAPKYKQIGIFTLTPTGLKEISCCPRRGFHAHRQDTALFCDCSHVTTRNIMVTVTVHHRCEKNFGNKVTISRMLEDKRR